MSTDQITLAKLQIYDSQFKLRARICYAMIVSGLITLLFGGAMLYVGLAKDQALWVDASNVKVTAQGFGAVTVIAALGWGVLAYRTRPLIQSS